MTEITIRDYGSSDSMHYTIKVGDWEMDDWAGTLEDAFKMIAYNLKWDYREHERDREDAHSK